MALNHVQLNYTSGQVADPFEPTDDDQGVINDVTVSRVGGSSARVEKTTGPLSVNPPPAGVGRYDVALDLSLARDTDTADQAAWRVHRGTWDEARYPSVRVDLAAASSLIPAVTASDMGDLLTVTNLPSWLPPGAAHQLVQGYTETLDPYGWSVTFNAAPYGPYRAAVLNSATYGRLDSENSTLAGALTTTQTAVDVVTAYGSPTWITTDTFPGDFPFDVAMGGEVARVTAATHSVSDDFSGSGAPAALASDTFTRTVNFSNLADDSFTRTVTDSWGTATSGQVWTNVGEPTWWDVDGSKGTLTMAGSTSTPTQELGITNTTDGELKTTVTCTVQPTGAPIRVLLRGRTAGASSTAMVQAVLVCETSGNLSIELTGANGGTTLGTVADVLTGITNVAVKVRFRYADKILRLRVWKSTDAEPTAWSLERADTQTPAAGKVQIAATRASNTNTSPVVTFDDFDLDNFVGGWGNADTGQAWTRVSGGANAWWETRSATGKGVVTFPVAATVTGQELAVTPQQDFDATLTLTNPQLPTGADLAAYFGMRTGSGSHVQLNMWILTTGNLSFDLNGNNNSATLGSVANVLTSITNVPIKVRFLAVAKEIKVKFWKAADAEPTAWSLERTDTVATVAAGKVWLRGQPLTGNTNTNPELHFDDLTVRPPVYWGTADTGQTWVHGGTAANFHVADGSGVQALASAVNVFDSAVVATTSSKDEDIRASVVCVSTPTGGSIHADLVARFSTSSDVIARMSFTTAGNVDLTLYGNDGFTLLASKTAHLTGAIGTQVHARLYPVGTALRFKVWTGGTEPQAWTLTGTDTVAPVSGTAGVRGARGTGNTNTNPILRWDNFAVTNPQTFTVTRSTNGIVKTHAAGTQIRLATPTYIAL